MLAEISEIIGLQVYTTNGIYLGNVNNVIIDIKESKIGGLFITDTNPLLVEESRNVSVPYRWVQSIGDIVLLRFFPKSVHFKREEETKEKL
ncbi:MAG: PRC-barrel domain-containing protein [Candidatus Thermoplasmatota archaeon]